MLDSICSPVERNEILYQWKEDPHLLRRNTFIGDCYNAFQKDQSATTLLRMLMANYILEGIYFYSGFMFFYNLSRNGKMPGSAQEIKHIGKGEQTMFKQHKFWAAVMSIAMLMSLITGMVMTHPGKPEEKS